MKEHLSHISQAKIAIMHELKEAYEKGYITLEEVRERMIEEVGQVSPEEYALMEQTYTPTDDPEACLNERLDYINQVFQGEWSNSCPDLPDGHPVKTYYLENSAIKGLIAQIKVLLEKTFIKNPWLELIEKLQQVKIHYSRKQNQLYPLFERKGFTHPSTTMWTYDDLNRDNISEALCLLKSDEVDVFLEHIQQSIPKILDLIDKEERILLPTALEMMTEEEFKTMRSGDDEIGYCLIPKPIGFRPEEVSEDGREANLNSFGAELQELMKKYGYGTSAKGGELLKVATGELSLEQINLIYKHMPVDLSFVDEHDLVKFYTDTKHRVFPRSSGVIGREVRNCHPPKSVHIVEEIIEKFRSGEKDEIEFWINKPDIFIYIYYVAVRDEEGRFRGVLEMMQDCTHIRSLKGSQVLLNWEQENNEAKAKTKVSESIELTLDTKISELIDSKPVLKKELSKINPKFELLQNPVMYKLMGRKAKIKDLAGRSGMDPEELLKQVKELYESL